MEKIIRSFRGWLVVGLITINIQTSRAQGVVIPTVGPSAMMKSLDQLQPRSPIAVPYAITTPGAYYLTQNITVGTGSAITISANNVRLDLNGFTITSTASPPSGMAILFSTAVTNVSIANGFIFGWVTNNNGSSFGGSGFVNGIGYAGSFTPVNARVSDMMISGCLSNGIALNPGPVGTAGNQVDGCLVNNFGNFGILADNITDCVVYGGSGNGGGLYGYNTVRSRGFTASGSAIGIYGSHTIENCAGQSVGGFGIYSGNLAINSYGKSTSGLGLSENLATMAESCYGETASGSAALIVWSANNCFGNHTGAGGIGLQTVSQAIGSVGETAGSTGYGIKSATGILNGCIGVGATNVLYGFKYNMP